MITQEIKIEVKLIDIKAIAEKIKEIMSSPDMVNLTKNTLEVLRHNEEFSRQIQLANEGAEIALNAFRELGVTTFDSSKSIKDLTNVLNDSDVLTVDSVIDKCKKDPLFYKTLKEELREMRGLPK